MPRHITLRPEPVSNQLSNNDADTGASLAELPCGLHVNLVQQEVQQRGSTTAHMHDRRHSWLAFEPIRTWHAPVVRIERVTLVRLLARGG